MGVIMNKTKLYRIAENITSNLFSYFDGETDFNTVYKVLDNAIENIRSFREKNECNNNDLLWDLFCVICHHNHVFQVAFFEYKKDLMKIINE